MACFHCYNRTQPSGGSLPASGVEASRLLTNAAFSHMLRSSGDAASSAKLLTRLLGGAGEEHAFLGEVPVLPALKEAPRLAGPSKLWLCSCFGGDAANTSCAEGLTSGAEDMR